MSQEEQIEEVKAEVQAGWGEKGNSKNIKKS